MVILGSGWNCGKMVGRSEPEQEHILSGALTSSRNELGGLVRAYAEAVEAKLGTYLGEVRGPSELVAAMGYAVLGPGKRIRPALVLMCNEACGGDEKAALTAGCAVEMVHAYSLVHDDLPSMDDDDMRRGRATCHKVYGEAVAILAGDALLSEAFGIIAKEIHSAELAQELVRELSEACGSDGMVGGQAADMLTQGRGGDTEMLEYIHANKTAKLIRASCRMGALTGGANDEQLEALGEYGQAVGLAFQVIDDLLDVEGDAELVGKAVGKDDGAGKLTYPSIVGVEAAREKVRSLGEEARAALKVLGKRGERLTELAELLARRVT